MDREMLIPAAPAKPATLTQQMLGILKMLEMILLGMCQKHVQKPSATVVSESISTRCVEKVQEYKNTVSPKNKKGDITRKSGDIRHTTALYPTLSYVQLLSNS
jgi:hypothetical protein